MSGFVLAQHIQIAFPICREMDSIRGLISAPSVGDDNSDSEADIWRRVEEVDVFVFVWVWVCM
jgi:hypothetical protein